MDILRITTAGSVDDGKSTLIGRLLYDTNSITSDKLEAITATSKRKGLDFVDLSLLTDGLVAEREQGITIDVAYIYLSTAKRKYIIADTPGHIEYTRNMVTGASTASVFIILVDARQGITEQTRRHFYIASLLRIKTVAVCINKMDLVRYEERTFLDIQTDFNQLIENSGFQGQSVSFIPVNAKDSHNITTMSKEMPWYEGLSLLQFLEAVQPEIFVELPARFPVQFVIRPQQDAFHDFRGLAGTMESGSFSLGDEVVVLPSGKKSKIANISRAEEQVNSVTAKESVVISLTDDLDVSRGCMLVSQHNPCEATSSLVATICWMVDESIGAGQTILLQHNFKIVKAKVTSVNSILDIHTMELDKEKSSFELNDIGEINLKLASPIFADCYNDNPANGFFILVNEFTNNTVAVGFVKQLYHSS